MVIISHITDGLKLAENAIYPKVIKTLLVPIMDGD